MYIFISRVTWIVVLRNKNIYNFIQHISRYFRVTTTYIDMCILLSNLKGIKCSLWCCSYFTIIIIILVIFIWYVLYHIFQIKEVIYFSNCFLYIMIKIFNILDLVLRLFQYIHIIHIIIHIVYHIKHIKISIRYWGTRSYIFLIIQTEQTKVCVLSNCWKYPKFLNALFFVIQALITRWARFKRNKNI